MSWVASSSPDPIVPSVHFIWTRFQAVSRVYISEIHWSQRPTKSLYKVLRYFAHLQRLTKMPGPSLQKRGASEREGKINKSPKWELPTLILNHQNLTVGKLSTREFIKNSLKTSHYHNHDQRKFSNEQLSTMIFFTWAPGYGLQNCPSSSNCVSKKNHNHYEHTLSKEQLSNHISNVSNWIGFVKLLVQQQLLLTKKKLIKVVDNSVQCYHHGHTITTITTKSMPFSWFLSSALPNPCLSLSSYRLQCKTNAFLFDPTTCTVKPKPFY